MGEKKHFKYPPAKMFASAFMVAFFGAVPYSYQSVLNQRSNIIKNFINGSFYAHYGVALSAGNLNVVWGVVASSILVGCFVGGATFNAASERFGRKTSALVINGIIVIVGSVIQAVSKSANSFELFIIGRFITGISVVWSIMCSVYLSECAPDYCRGFCSVMVSVMFGFWSMMVTVFALPTVLGGETLWPVLMVYGAPFALCAMVLSRYLPESPKYLYIHKKDEALASRSIQFFHGSNVDIDSILAEFHRENNMAQNERDYTFKGVMPI